MKYEIKLASLKKKLPDSTPLPKSFWALIDRCRVAQRGDWGWFSIKYSSPKALLGFDPKASLIPFLSLPDGGLVALWFGPKQSNAIAWIGHDGDAKIVGASWTDFLARWSVKKSKVPDLDDQLSEEFPKFKGVAKRFVPLQAKRKEFNQWLKTHAEDTHVDEDVSERIRRTLFRLVKKHLDKPSSGYSSCQLSVTCTSRSFKVDWYCFPPKPYAEAERLRPVLEELVQMLGRSLKKSDITIDNDGCVFVEGNICLGDPSLYADID